MASNGVPPLPPSPQLATVGIRGAHATSASLWAVCMGFAKLQIPWRPPIQCVGRREHRMAPLAITLALRPIDPQERARVRKKVSQVLGPDKTLPPGHVYIGRGHHSHRLPVTQWACPFVPGHNCGADEWMALHERLMSNLAADLKSLE